MQQKSRYEIISNKKILCKVGNYYISYKAGVLYRHRRLGGNAERLLSLPASKIKSVMVKNRLCERAFRLEPRLAMAISNSNFLLSFQGKVYCIDLEGNFDVEHLYRDGMNNPLGFCFFDGRVIYGEYFGNKNYEEVCIYERNARGHWGMKYAFRPGEVLHIHQIVPDTNRSCFWILTGDADSESGIWRADFDFRTVVPIFRGKQKYRSCFIIPTEEGLAFATDSPLEKNGIYYTKENSSGMWEKPQLIYELPGPCIYGTSLLNGKYVLATSVEPDSSVPSLQYSITDKLGKGVNDRFTHLVTGNPRDGFKELVKFKKDYYKMGLFQFGNVMFPNNIMENRCIFTGQALKKIDGKTVVVDIESF